MVGSNELLTAILFVGISVALFGDRRHRSDALCGARATIGFVGCLAIRGEQ